MKEFRLSTPGERLVSIAFSVLVILGLGGLDAVEDHGSGIGALMLADDHGAGALRPDLQLVGSGGAEGVACNQQNLLALLDQPGGDLADGGGLAHAVDADDQIGRASCRERV